MFWSAERVHLDSACNRDRVPDDVPFLHAPAITSKSFQSSSRRSTSFLRYTMWSSSHIHGPRRSHDQSRNDIKASRASSPDDSGTEGNQRRTSSDATPRQAPATTRFLDSVNDQHANWSVLSPASALSTERSEGYSSSKRLGYFADKLTSSLSGTGKDTSTSLKNSLHPGQLLHPHSHSRVESSSTTAPSLSSTMASSSTLTSANKAHASPSKVSCSMSSTNIHRWVAQIVSITGAVRSHL